MRKRGRFLPTAKREREGGDLKIGVGRTCLDLYGRHSGGGEERVESFIFSIM